MKTSIRELLALNVKQLMKLIPEASTQAKLAVRAGMSQSSIHRIVNAATEPELTTLENLAKAFGVPIGRLLAEEGDDLLPPGAVDAYRNLPSEDKEKIKAFIEFVLASRQAEKLGLPLNFSERLSATESGKETARGLKQRRPSDNTLTSHERKDQPPRAKKHRQ